MKKSTPIPSVVFVMLPELRRLARTKGLGARIAGLAQVFRLPILFQPVNSMLERHDLEAKNSCRRHTEELAALRAIVERPK